MKRRKERYLDLPSRGQVLGWVALLVSTFVLLIWGMLWIAQGVEFILNFLQNSVK